MPKSRTLAYLALLGSVAIWGAALPIVKPALSHATPLQFLFLRLIIASVIMLPFLIHTIRKKSIPLSLVPKIILIEVIGFASLYLTYLGLDRTSALQASLIMNTSPIFITLAGIIFLHETEEPREWLGLILAVIGTFTIFLTPLFSGSGLGFDRASLIGSALILGTVLIHTTTMLAVKKSYEGVDKFGILAISALANLAFFSIFILSTNNLPTWEIATQKDVLRAIFYMGILGTPIASGLRIFGVLKIEVSEATLFTYLQPLIYIPLTVLWLHESINLTQILGLITIIIGVSLAEYRPDKTGLLSKIFNRQDHDHHLDHHHIHHR
jgi:drug/metabolite transporter (DMT)-like permease